MSEEQETKQEEAKESEESATPEDDGSKEGEEPTLVDKAEDAAERLEKANAKAEELASRGILSGKAVLNNTEEEKEETNKEYADRVMNGESEKKDE
tara:strand:- start:416 stop:703 length:288 start_codon:yes stop_codon:yes gene_type:complete